MEECLICSTNQKYYAYYNCNENHIICLECSLRYNNCYFNCQNGYLNFDTLIVNNK
jgi:hypothetical protein